MFIIFSRKTTPSIFVKKDKELLRSTSNPAAPLAEEEYSVEALVSMLLAFLESFNNFVFFEECCFCLKSFGCLLKSIWSKRDILSKD